MKPYRNAVAQYIKYTKVIFPSECHEWQGALDKDGYPLVHLGDRCRRACRVYFEFFSGTLLGKLEPDHQCHNRACVNFMHMQAVPKRINIARGNRRRWLKS